MERHACIWMKTNKIKLPVRLSKYHHKVGKLILKFYREFNKNFTRQFFMNNVILKNIKVPK